MLRPLVERLISTDRRRLSVEARSHNRGHHPPHNDQPADKATSAPIPGAPHDRPARRVRYQRSALYGALLITPLLLTGVVTSSVLALAAPSTNTLRQDSSVSQQPCLDSGARCDGVDDGGGSDAPSRGVDAGRPAPDAPPCAQLCERIQRTYHDPRTQNLLFLLAQTPTGRAALDYLLTMGARLGEKFITWQDLSAVRSAGVNNAGGYIQLNSAALTGRDLGPIFLAGALVHESVESYFDVAEGIRDMGTRHADYVAQWFNGRFERELHSLPYYQAQDPFYLPGENSSYGLSYRAWLNDTDDGRLYRRYAENGDLRNVDRRGRAWGTSDWWAEQGGFWFLGQGRDVTPVPNPLALSTVMLVSADLTVLAS